MFSPNILWKLPKVSFREIVSMKTVPPCFKEEALERITSNDSSDNVRRGMDLVTPNVTQGQSPDFRYMNTLHESMAELKQDFTSLRIKLDDPSQFSAEQGDQNGMVTTLLLQTELIGKLRREVEALKQENEALNNENKAFKLGNQYTKKQTGLLPASLSATETPDPDAQSSDMLQGNRKRSWGDAFPVGHTLSIADSFESVEGDVYGRSGGDSQARPISMALEGPKKQLITANSATVGNAASGTLMLPMGENKQLHQPQRSQVSLDEPHEPNSRNHHLDQVVSKRPRISEPSELPSTGRTVSKRPGPGRPRKSEKDPKPAPLAEQSVHKGIEQRPTPNAVPPGRGTGRKRGRPPLKDHSKRRGSRAQYKASPVRRKPRHSVGSDSDDDYIPAVDGSRVSNDAGESSSNGTPEGGINMQNGSEKENPAPMTKNSQKHADGKDAAGRQTELTARREKEVRIAMAQEEARQMDTF